MEHGLTRLGLHVAREVRIDVEFDGMVMERALRADLLVDRRVVLEVKASESPMKYCESQLLAYMLHGRFPLGFAINFREPHLRNGISRFIHSRADVPSSVAPSRP